MELIRGLFFRYNEHAVMETSIKSVLLPHLCFFYLILICGLSKCHIRLCYNTFIQHIFDNLCFKTAEVTFCVPQDGLISRSLPCLSILSLYLQ